jgi:hypothetical protein
MNEQQFLFYFFLLFNLYHVKECHLAVVDVKVAIRLTEMATKAMVVVTFLGEDNGVLESVLVTPH